MMKARAKIVLMLALASLVFACTNKEGDKEKKDSKEKEYGVENMFGGVTSVPTPPGETPGPGGTLIWRIGAEPGTLNPITATDAYEQLINSFILESLVGQDIKTGEIEPALAESWEVGEDKVTFTFHLRKDATFHDGHPVDADDVIHSMDLIMDPKVDAPVLRSYYSDMESYQKIDDHTVRIRWKKPYFLALEFAGGVPVMPKHIIDDGTDFNKHPYGRKPIGSGPYKFVKWDTGQRIVVEKNEDYWGDKPYLERIQWKIITGDEVALQVLKKGEIDFLQRLSPTLWVRRASSERFMEQFNKLYYDYPTYNYIGWNLRKPMFQDKRTRQALTMLLNREVIKKEVYHNLATIADGPFFPKNGYDDPNIESWPYDPERAKTLLAAVGWADHDNDGILDMDGKPFRFELSFTAGVAEWERLAIIWQEDMKKVGIDMRIRTFEWAVFAENVAQWKFDACAMSWALTSKPDPYQLWHSSQADVSGSSNHVGFKNDRVDALIELNRREYDAEVRKKYCREIHRIIHEEQPYTFNMVRKELSVVDKRVKNIHPYSIRPVFEFDKWYIPASMRKY